MNKPKICAKQALEDIQAGNDDDYLMKKYRLSPKGLQSLFQKLGQAGIIKHLNAHEVMADLRTGISSQGLMKKYGLTSEGLQNLFQELDRAGLLRGTAEQRGVPSKVVINIHRIAEDIRVGLTKSQLMQKYHLSARGLRWISMTLISSGAIAWWEIYDSLCANYEDLIPDRLRQTRRYPLPFHCPVHEADNPHVVGQLRDVSENGLGVVGMRARTGDTKNLVIQGDEFGEFASFSLESTCRWITKDQRGVFVAGFEISHISIGNLKEFELLLHIVKSRVETNRSSVGGTCFAEVPVSDGRLTRNEKRSDIASDLMD
ncbi:PilZ domain-containing protein [Desulfomonile tiedjei]|uniref:PilZ domain-containing protein n=1 Tax=Desulfomonile tiedjei (strain ATCC 49306 / DSM 6799 / DCB-1) TaxID=706587 RepID=I4C9G8_DESTA|nr:PilZ domain-containing protein [Desulfomonile tiedjei]AFM26209.1 PilZ domain-containing protein [Desulfomonile tiedjei DSM 6799]